MARTENLTIMFTDMVDYTERTSRQSRAQNEAMLLGLNSVMLPVIADFGGRRIKSIGDALLVTFHSPTDAVHCGMALQDAMVEYNAHNRDTPVLIRIAINVGEVRVEGRDVYGEAVNVASRVESVAEPGQIVFTEAVYLAMNKAEVPSEALGECKLKGIPEPVRLYRVPSRQVNRLVATGEEMSRQPGELPYGGMHLLRRKRSLMARLRSAGPQLVGLGIRARGQMRTGWSQVLPHASLVAMGLLLVLGALLWRQVDLGDLFASGSAHADASAGNSGAADDAGAATDVALAATAPGAAATPATANAGVASTADGMAGDSSVFPPAPAPAANASGGEMVAALAAPAQAAIPADATPADIVKLAHAAYGRNQRRDAVALYAAALQREPALKSNATLVADLVGCLSRAHDVAMPLIQANAGPEMVAALAQRATQPGPQGRARARELLVKLKQEAAIDRGALLLTELSEAPAGCAVRIGLIEREVAAVRTPRLQETVGVMLAGCLDENDPRLLPLVRELKSEPVVAVLAGRAIDPGNPQRGDAIRFLREAGLENRLDAGAVALADLHEAGSCEAKVAAVRRLRDLKDRRALPALQALLGQGVGDWFKTQCYRNDVTEAIKVIERSG